ncbi:VCBS repeat-containing protein [Seonamhaeicola sp.]|uniref:VCBS repeat-containing protein n=1 Tax=Seonamhaeicola sp. TaxID=1912245 RepID=UPI0026293710|nr:VCBS repeat-containing protein [Seonamhaeicola sp.]
MTLKTFINALLFFLLIIGSSCTEKSNKNVYDDGKNTPFTLIPESHSNVTFKNTVKEDLYFNFLNYTYIYNGGGVAIGDINNDGLEDIYFTSNQNSNKLYLNKGDFVFEDITETAGVKDDTGWSTGVSMVDINNDGWLDIYVCKSGALKDHLLRRNKLYINQKNNTFKEEGAKYRLNLSDFSVQGYFFDFDKDGDLDMYLVNHREDFNNSNAVTSQKIKQLTLKGSDLLLRNENGRFFNITRNAGVANKAWGLSASIGDFNNDSWPDIYVANDFWEPDLLYINNKNGTFTDEILTRFKHIPTNSMGSDFADINNDLLPDLVVLDMLAADRKRSKENMATMSTEDFNYMVAEGYHYQYMSNMLQLNNDQGLYSEISQFSGIAKTDWSWAPLVADFNNDGYNDLFVTNGIEHDLSNQDFRNKMRENIVNKKKVSLDEAIGMMPSTKLANYMFLNNTDYTFKNVSNDFGFNAKVNSNGAAYADLDNDGDLDLVLNNQSDMASIYRNNTNGNFLSVALKGPEKNIKAIGTKVEIFADDLKQLKEVYPTRGYQSSVDYRLIFGLGDFETIDSLKVIWSDNKVQVFKNIKANKTLKISYSGAKNPKATKTGKSSIFKNVKASELGISYKHEAVDFDDYKLQLLLPQKQSTIDNPLTVADVNNDGLQDIFIGNTSGHPAELYVQNRDGSFTKTSQSAFLKDRKYNDNNALFFDADNDKDLDLYIASGNYSQPENSILLQDRLYINDGKGNFSKGKLPKMLTVTKAIAVDDFDGDGDNDLFVGGRVIPGKYPQIPPSYLLENRNGNFVNVIDERAKEAKFTGLINDAIFSDYDSDGDKDLILAGEWMPVMFFNNDNGIYTEETMSSNNSKTGWFQSIKASDFDGDGDEDYLVGNFGENNKFHPTEASPLHIYANNFDTNESYDIALSKEYGGELFPTRGKECSSEQTPFLKEKIATYKEFANSNIFEVYGEEKIEGALHLQAATFSSYLILNDNGHFKFNKLPNAAQFAPTLDFELLDINNDNTPEVIGVGGVYDSEVETIRYDASKGYVLTRDSDSFKTLTLNNILTNNEVKAIERIDIKGSPHVILLNSNDELSLLMLKK